MPTMSINSTINGNLKVKSQFIEQFEISNIVKVTQRKRPEKGKESGTQCREGVRGEGGFSSGEKGNDTTGGTIR